MTSESVGTVFAAGLVFMGAYGYGESHKEQVPVSVGPGVERKLSDNDNTLIFIANSLKAADGINCGGVERPLFFDDKNHKRIEQTVGSFTVKCELSTEFDADKPIIYRP